MFSDDRMVIIVDYGSQRGRKGQNRGGAMVQGLTVKGKALEDKRVKRAESLGGLVKE